MSSGARSRSGSTSRLIRAATGPTVWQAPWYRWDLLVGDAASYDISDDAELGGADVNAVTYDRRRGLVTSRSRLCRP